ncbi:MAG TPA: DEAD/DEAH box helicase [Candidatus Sulfopaludibacter sp.]|jgi:superfamily II DNA or RNA helicase|nr:DEAD/DEAH box helicase [Candidatus Sulfopaludibacter sp.]
MPLASKLAFQLARGVQYQGQRLFEARSVRITDGASDHAAASVADGRLYDVHLMLIEGGQLLVKCTCANFRSRSACQHLWAAILEADRERVLEDVRDVRYLRIKADMDTLQPVRSFTDQSQGRAAPAQTPQQAPWKEYLTAIRHNVEEGQPGPHVWPSGLEIAYAIDLAGSRSASAMVVELYSRTLKKGGTMTAFKEFRVAPSQVQSLPDPLDAEIISLMLGGSDQYSYSYTYNSRYGASLATTARKALPGLLATKILSMAAGAKRLMLNSEGRLIEAQWDDGEPWKLALQVRQDERDQWNVTGILRSGERTMPLAQPELILQSGFLVAGDRVARFDPQNAFAWVRQLRTLGRIPFPDRERDTVLAGLLDTPGLPPMELDEPLRFEERRSQPGLGLRIIHKRDWNGDYFEARLMMDYGRGWMLDKPGGGIWLPEDRVYVVRDLDAENGARNLLSELGLKPLGDGALRLQVKAMPRSVRELIQAGWHVEAEGKAFRRPGEARVDVRSGIDWFELHGEVEYGDVKASLPQLLAALRRGDTMVPLGDGSFGLLPEEWLERFAPLAGLGTAEKDFVRFRQNQAGLLDALLAAQPDVRVDEVFERVRDRIRSFRGVQAAEQPDGFHGRLRDYQREGLGWMEFLREFGFGGCLADDMGVGKTAQVLALLESRRGQERGPSLVVAPKSLMFNWQEEAARFTPGLRVLVHTGISRDTGQIAEHDLVLTTYGTVLRDAPRLSEIKFDYVVLDEAQAVKNASTASAKAVRLLHGNHRLALSGTPVENHLGELWSLFEFLNPGMLGEAKVLKMAGGLGRNPSPEARTLLAQALRPFILRRTKQQVARELPAKTEQTIFCELEGPQRKHYDELLVHFRNTLLNRVQTQGLAKSKMHVLEALLRLRQAACHTGLIDPKQVDQPSAKLETLLAQLDELRQEGHKALVFSQFTSLLAIVRKRLDQAGVRYEYLDGNTRDRQTHVETFQNDPDCGLFLISLKAGGLGLNLTAAEYVFLLDPWWNPAVEAQAVDRAHRIGQTKPVFAYRLIARDTVEEKVLELQKTKRDLADALLGEDNSLIRDLKKEDLELLLS